jgi:hypothetical protein
MKIALGVFIIFFGVLLIIQGFSWELPLRIIQNFLSLWPFLIILIGIAVLSNVKGLRWLRWIHLFLSLAFFATLLFLPPTHIIWGQMKNPVAIQVELPKDTESIVYLDFDLKAAKVRIYSTEDDETMLIQGTYQSRSQDFIVESFDNRILFRSSASHFFPAWNDELLLYLPDRYQYSTHFFGGVIDLEYESRTNLVSAIEVETGVCNLNVNLLSWKHPLFVRISSGITNARFFVPKDSRVHSDVQGGIKNTSFTAIQENGFGTNLSVVIESGIINLSVRGR